MVPRWPLYKHVAWVSSLFIQCFKLQFSLSRPEMLKKVLSLSNLYYNFYSPRVKFNWFSPIFGHQGQLGDHSFKHCSFGLTHWGLVTHICFCNLTNFGSDNLSHCWNTVNWTLRNKLQWNFNRNSDISFQKMHLKVSSAKWQPFCFGLNVLTHCPRVEVAVLFKVWFSNSLYGIVACMGTCIEKKMLYVECHTDEKWTLVQVATPSNHLNP